MRKKSHIDQRKLDRMQNSEGQQRQRAHPLGRQGRQQGHHWPTQGVPRLRLPSRLESLTILRL